MKKDEWPKRCKCGKKTHGLSKDGKCIECAKREYKPPLTDTAKKPSTASSRRRAFIRKLIRKEDRYNPINDSELHRELSGAGFGSVKISTVRSDRYVMKIPNAENRKRNPHWAARMAKM